MSAIESQHGLQSGLLVASGGQPLVDVNLITYNHENFIARAIESVLEQKTDFEYRLIIGDDCSTDKTQSIIRDYAEQYPALIHTLLAPEHRGIHDRDRVGVQALKLNTAKYVAPLDGDDYWCDPYKLQKQVAFLEGHSEFAICFHDVKLQYDGLEQGREKFCASSQKQVTTIDDLLGGNYLPTSSVVFRNQLFGDLPEWFYDAMMGDWMLHILNAQHGKIRYLNEVMGVYRVHGTGFWTSLNAMAQAKDNLKIVEQLVQHLSHPYKRHAIRAKAKAWKYLSETYYQQGDMAKARAALIHALDISISNGFLPDRQSLGRLVKLQTFHSYEWLRIRFTRT
ncbi:MAG: glycosyltransferase [Pyrinomonadaceae bacterium]